MEAAANAATYLGISTPEMTRVLVVSPHLDDGILSAGGAMLQLAQRGATVVLVTVFSGSPPLPLSSAARAFHAKCGLADTAMETRSQEDDAACRSIGVRPVRLGLPEALYRHNADGGHRYPEGRSIFDVDPEREDDVVRVVEGRVRGLVAEFNPNLVIAPLGVGGHIDHTITQLALRRSRIPAAQVWWFEDLPYVLYRHVRGWEDDMPLHLVPFDMPITEADWQRKIEAVKNYRSQLNVLWYEPVSWRDQMRTYAGDLGEHALAERFWKSQ